MNITVNTTDLRPATIGSMIADMMDWPSPYNLPTIKALIAQLEITVGEDDAIKFIIDAGATPEQLIEMWDLVAE